MSVATDRTDQDVAGAVPLNVQWGDVLFRFRIASMYVVYSTQFGSAAFTAFMAGTGADSLLE